MSEARIRSLDQMAEIAVAIQTLQEAGVWSLYTGSALYTGSVARVDFHTGRDNFKNILHLTGAAPEFKFREQHGNWEAAIVHEGIRYLALYSAVQLAEIGYQPPEYSPQAPTPVPIAATP